MTALILITVVLFGVAMYLLGRHDGYGEGYDAGVTDGWAKLPRKPKQERLEI